MARPPRIHGANLAPARLARRLLDLLGPTSTDARHTLTALFFNSTTSFVAGATLAGMNDTLRRLPGLLVLVTPAIGLRGNVFSTFGSRLSTAIHTGTYSRALRKETTLGQNLIASFVLSAFMSTVLAAIAKIVAVAVGIPDTIGILDLAAISVLGGLLGSIPAALVTVSLSRRAAQKGWDLDNIVSPTDATLGDVMTVPALWAAAELVGRGQAGTVVGVTFAVLSVVAVIWALRSKLALVPQIVKESIPVLGVALVLSALGGIVLQKQLDLLVALPALLVLQPAFVSSGGALGGVLSGRVSTKLHLGAVDSTMIPGPAVRRDMYFLLALAAPVFIYNSVGATLVSGWTQGSRAPGWGWMLVVTTIAAVLTMIAVIATSYFATIGAWRIEVDPDSYGVPVVTSLTDFVGTVVLVFTVTAFALS